jgi:DNA-binding FadR family transcriptional regulator
MTPESEHELSATDRELEETIRRLLAARALSSTICASDAARAVSPDDWRDLMEPARRAARRMVAAGEVHITQGGAVVDPLQVRGPIRIRRRA